MAPFATGSKLVVSITTRPGLDDELIGGEVGGCTG